MDENKDTPQKTAEETNVNSNNGDNQRTPSILERANQTAERLDKLNQELDSKLQRMEELAVETKLSGTAQLSEKEQPRDLSPKEYAKAFREGKITMN